MNHQCRDQRKEDSRQSSSKGKWAEASSVGSGDGKNLGCLGRGQWCQKRSVPSAREDQMADGSVRQERHSYFALGIMETVGV